MLVDRVALPGSVLDLLAELQASSGLAHLFISHDLAVVRRVAHRAGVMREGRLVEPATAAQLFNTPEHEYTRKLLAAVAGRRAHAGEPA